MLKRAARLMLASASCAGLGALSGVASRASGSTTAVAPSTDRSTVIDAAVAPTGTTPWLPPVNTSQVRLPWLAGLPQSRRASILLHALP